MNPSEGKKVHMTSRDLGSLKISGCLDGYIVINNPVKHNKACLCPSIF